METRTDPTSIQPPKLLNFRPPSSFAGQTSPATDLATFAAPTIDWVKGTWYVTHSSLPMWKTRRNVAITYTPLGDPPDAFDNLVEYQSLSPSSSSNDSVRTVRGVEKADAEVSAAWNWRGKGWLMIASSSWEVLGWGGDEDGGGGGGGGGGSWMVIYFRKTLFTPAGVDLLRREGGRGADQSVFQAVRDRMRADVTAAGGGGRGDAGLGKCVDDMFPVKHDL